MSTILLTAEKRAVLKERYRGMMPTVRHLRSEPKSPNKGPRPDAPMQRRITFQKDPHSRTLSVEREREQVPPNYHGLFHQVANVFALPK